MHARSKRASIRVHCTTASDRSATLPVSRPRARARQAATHRLSAAYALAAVSSSAASGRPAAAARSAPAARAYPSHPAHGELRESVVHQGPGGVEAPGVEGQPGVDECHARGEDGRSGSLVALGDDQRTGAPLVLETVIAQPVGQRREGHGRGHPPPGRHAVALPLAPQRVSLLHGLSEPARQREDTDPSRRGDVGVLSERIAAGGPLDQLGGGRQVPGRQGPGDRDVEGVRDLGCGRRVVAGQVGDEPQPLGDDLVGIAGSGLVVQRVRHHVQGAEQENRVAGLARRVDGGGGAEPGPAGLVAGSRRGQQCGGLAVRRVRVTRRRLEQRRSPIG